ncbi:lipopolysaccharide transport protein LptA [Chitinophaga ginsengisegetis]|uniref:Lipopolysaccharide transport protein LptA n=1 Tax=Chitinophaga ginsengisegetis TaxID=393003 RepID=A0A1T5PD08_9BACT|nr:OstA-like protein [Chitinophaga ginsengisegetis]MDR6569290.1 lipopolysaccharide transport protein LptA [Chitinophaga ginsengisegetis]MDR6648679.1 lipopolysaccharide transport protein LptA [Chitinophaga ginsengisegetis]MDR6655373.1 lipopolysaccharide transport protein LptA [Chitinophaga ginsengisegetis]SKD10229.1 lipopolysaccharide transport protein LptA [Chitinophaga ginsengisegetis]
MHRYIKSGIFLAVICLLAATASAQFPAQPAPKTGSVIEIIHADTLIMNEKDSISVTRFIGNAVFKQGTTLFNCDSAVKNNKTNIIDAYGHIHINQADSVHIYGNYLNYDANTRIALLRENAKLTDGKVTITGPELQYDMNAKIGSYVKTGKLVNGKSVLTSDEGYYYTDTKEMHFMRNVLLVDPEYTLSTDELLYNTDTKIATIVAPTTINNNDKSVMYATSGYYDTEKGYGNFGNRPTIEDSTGTITADNIEMDKLTGMAYATGNMVYKDTARKMSLLANRGIVNQREKTVLATQKPLLIMEKNKDTLYMAADTLFSGVIRPDDSLSIPSVAGLKRIPDSPTKNLKTIKNIRPPEKFTATISPITRGDSIARKQQDSVAANVMMFIADSTLAKTRQKLDSAVTNIKVAPIPDVVMHDSLPGIKHHADSMALTAPKDTSEQRYILAYHHVKIFSDSLQGVADSVYYSSKDSIFRFYGTPVLWSNNTTQLSGDTILMFTKNQTADKMLLKNNGFIINEAGPGMFNQIKGNVITGYVLGETLDWMHVEGNAETINYIKDKAGAYMSVNKAQCAIINIFFKKGEVDKVVLIKDPEGTVYPFTQRPKEQLLLENFKWDIKRQPKTKYELMQ